MSSGPEGIATTREISVLEKRFRVTVPVRVPDAESPADTVADEIAQVSEPEAEHVPATLAILPEREPRAESRPATGIR